MILSEFEVKFVPQKAVKGQVLVDFLAAHPVLDNGELSEDFPDEEVFNIEASSWQSLFSWGCKKIRGWSRSVFITPSGGLIPYSFSLLSLCSNNMAEYEALIIGLEMHIDSLQVFGDSQLIIKQINDQYAVKMLI